uniref:Polymer-forming cytoskeletal protein n=1 Tax=Fervidobacterium nodosum TaxID=2424 RepID=A0A7C5Y7N7_9BACT
MGEIPNDIRAVLEALARKEISVEDAEKLIIAIKQEKVQNKGKKSSEVSGGKSLIGKELVIEENQEYNGDIQAVNSKIIVKGKVKGDLELVFCELYFSGELDGDIEAVGCKLVWNGGTINGDIQMVGCNYSGKKPVVKGSVNEINNFFINGILGTVKFFVKPIISGIKIEE